MISAVFRLTEVEKQALSAKMVDTLSPQVTSSVMWFLRRWSRSYLLPDENYYSEVKVTYENYYSEVKVTYENYYSEVKVTYEKYYSEVKVTYKNYHHEVKVTCENYYSEVKVTYENYNSEVKVTYENYYSEVKVTCSFDTHFSLTTFGLPSPVICFQWRVSETCLY